LEVAASDRIKAVSVYELQVKVKVGEIIVTLPTSGFMAVYYKRAGHPFLTLRQHTETDDYELLAQGFRAAANKARELGWLRHAVFGEA
jgi:hypothetical protein